MTQGNKVETHLVEQYSEKCLEKQQYNPGDQTSMRGVAFHEWSGVFEGDNDETEDD